jgi:hypothetical protein
MRWHADVGVALAKLSSPFPHVSEHFLMKPQQVFTEALAKISPTLLARNRPD